MSLSTWETRSQVSPHFPLSLFASYCARYSMEGLTNTSKSAEDKKPTVLITIGMAGSGKTTFVQRVNSYLRSIPPKSASHAPEGTTQSAKPTPESSESPVAGGSSAPPTSISEPLAPYILNLDPAVTHMPYDPNIDIRDTIDYAEVMKQWVTRRIATPYSYL